MVDQINRKIDPVKISLKGCLDLVCRMQRRADKNITVLAQQVAIEGQPLNMVMVEMAKHEKNRPVFGNLHILEPAAGINYDLHVLRFQIKAGRVAAEMLKSRPGYRNRSAYTMKSNLHDLYVPVQPDGGSAKNEAAEGCPIESCNGKTEQGLPHTNSPVTSGILGDNQ